MDKLFVWLRVEPTGFRLWWFFAKTIAFSVLAGILLQNLLEIFGVPLRDEGELFPFMKEAPFFFTFIFLPLAAFIEEVIFRFPLVLFIRKNARPTTILIASIVLSAVFGYAHGGWWQIPLQGVTGLALFLVFLKCGGLQKKYGEALFSSSCVHLMYNWLSFALRLFSAGGT